MSHLWVRTLQISSYLYTLLKWIRWKVLVVDLVLKKFALIILPFPRFLNDENAADYVDAIACGFCKTNLTKGKEIELEDWYLLSHCTPSKFEKKNIYSKITSTNKCFLLSVTSLVEFRGQGLTGSTFLLRVQF